MSGRNLGLIIGAISGLVVGAIIAIVVAKKRSKTPLNAKHLTIGISV